MIPFSRMLDYGNEVVPFDGVFMSTTYSPIFSTRAESGYCYSSTGDAWVMGGVNAATFYSDFWKYDAVLDSWSSLASFGGGNRSSAAMCYDGTSKVYSFGGSSTQPSIPNQKNDLYVYDTGTGVWTLIQPIGTLPPAKLHAGMQYYNQKLYLYGGYEVQDMWEYDILNNVWTELNSSPYLKKYGTNTVLKGTDIYCIGYTGVGSSTNYFMKYDIINDTWSTLSSTTNSLGRFVQYGTAFISLGLDNGSTYRYYEGSSWELVSTNSSYPVDSNVFVPLGVPNGILSVYGKTSSGSIVNAIYKVK